MTFDDGYRPGISTTAPWAARTTLRGSNHDWKKGGRCRSPLLRWRSMSDARQLPAGCPPEGYIPADGVFYRLSWPSGKLGQTLPDESWVLPLDTKTSDMFQQFDECDAYSFSICSELDDLIKARTILGWAKKKCIVRLRLTPEMGVVLKTPSPVGDSHHDWWPSEGNEAPPSEVVAEQTAA